MLLKDAFTVKRTSSGQPVKSIVMPPLAGLPATGQDGRVYRANLALAGEEGLEGTLDFTLPDGTPMTARLVLSREKKD